jgi:hypothetical protein
MTRANESALLMTVALITTFACMIFHRVMASSRFSARVADLVDHVIVESTTLRATALGDRFAVAAGTAGLLILGFAACLAAR